MNVRMHSSTVPLSLGLRQHIERKLAQALGHMSHIVQSIRVTLEDVNGRRGGNDKMCKVLVTIPHGRTIVCRSLSADAYQAISDALDRVGFLLTARKRRTK